MKFVLFSLLILFCTPSSSSESEVTQNPLLSMQWLIGSWNNKENTFRQTYKWSQKRTQIHSIIEWKQASKWEVVVEANFIYHPTKELILAYGTSRDLELIFYELRILKTENGLELYSESIDSKNKKVSSVSFWYNISPEKFEILPIEVQKKPALPWLHGSWYKTKSK